MSKVFTYHIKTQMQKLTNCSSRKNFNPLFLGYDLETGTAAECTQQHLVLGNGYFDLQSHSAPMKFNIKPFTLS